MVGFDFYQSEYEGNVIPDEATFRALAREAEAQLRRYERIYTVEGDKDAKSRAICAMAESLYGFQVAQSGGAVASTSVGSVSTSYAVAEVDASPKAQGQELYRRASLYLDIRRGCGS